MSRRAIIPALLLAALLALAASRPSVAPQPATSRAATSQSSQPSTRAASGPARDAAGRIIRSEAARRAFMRQTGFPNGRPGYVIDHIIALKRGGADEPNNMQWQTVEEAKAKDKWE